MVDGLKSPTKASNCWESPDMSYTKRDATGEEVAEALRVHADFWNMRNPNHKEDDTFWNAKMDEAIAQGYKNETCSCGVTFLAFHHYTDCRAKGCPFSDGVTILERMEQSLTRDNQPIHE